MIGKEKVITIKNFYSTKLKNERDVYIYLPPSYDTNLDKRYPVLYMQDGQNLFYTPYSSWSEECWNVQKAAEQLISENKIKEIIIVGISSNSDRLGEYSHYSYDKVIGSEETSMNYRLEIHAKGFIYEEFVINELKPYIDSNFRTLKDSANTALVGSSGGGLVTYNIGFRNPDIFGNIGIMSPAFFWEEEKLLKLTMKKNLRVWIDVGEGEGHFVEETRRIVEHLVDIGFIEGRDLMYYEEPWAIHSGEAWGRRMYSVLLYFFGDVGKAIKCSLEGNKKIAASSKKEYINPIVEYESGIKVTKFNGNYVVENEEVAAVRSNGTIIPKRRGLTDIIFMYAELNTTEKYAVIDEMSDKIQVTISVKVPSSTPSNSKLSIMTCTTSPLSLNKIEEDLYRGTYTFKRNSIISFKFIIGALDFFIRNNNDVLIEKSSDMKDIDIRQFKAEYNMTLCFTVENWGKAELPF